MVSSRTSARRVHYRQFRQIVKLFVRIDVESKAMAHRRLRMHAIGDMEGNQYGYSMNTPA